MPETRCPASVDARRTTTSEQLPRGKTLRSGAAPEVADVRERRPTQRVACTPSGGGHANQPHALCKGTLSEPLPTTDEHGDPPSVPAGSSLFTTQTLCPL